MDYLPLAKLQIAEWETERPGLLTQTSNLLSWPVEKAAEALIPLNVQNAVGNAIHACLVGLTTQTNRTFDADAIGRSVAERAKKLSGRRIGLRHHLQAADEHARKYWRWHVAYAAAEGAATGASGFPGLAADIPALFAILLRQMQEIATSYGYDTNEESERDYLLQVLRAGSAASVKAKMEFLVSLKQFEQILLKVTWKKMGEDLAAKQFSKSALLSGLRQFSKTLGFQLTKRKALQMVPLVGGIVGASVNGTLANDIGKAAFMSYRRRWIAEHDHQDIPIQAYL